MRKSDHTAAGMRWYSEHSHGYSEYSHCRRHAILPAPQRWMACAQCRWAKSPPACAGTVSTHKGTLSTHTGTLSTHIRTLSTHTADGVRAVPLGEGPAGSATAEPPNRRRRDHT